jgi:hypothetical protein
LILAFLNFGSVLAKAIFSTIVAAAVGLAWARSSRAAKDWFLQRGGEMQGEWYGLLSAIGDAPERIDTYRIHQRGQKLTGHIERIRPAGRKGKWRLVGYVHGPVVVCLFYTKTPGKDPSSYGVICVHRVPGPSEDGAYQGYYTRPEFEPFDNFLNGSLGTRPITWQRVHPDECRQKT